MTAFVDTNVFIRHLTGEPPKQARRATAYLAGAHALLLTDLILAETAYVLESFYKTPRAQLAAALRSILTFPTVVAVDRSLLLRAVEVYEVDRLDFAEAYLVACAESTGVARVASFDRALDRISTIERVHP